MLGDMYRSASGCIYIEISDPNNTESHITIGLYPNAAKRIVNYLSGSPVGYGDGHVYIGNIMDVLLKVFKDE